MADDQPKSRVRINLGNRSTDSQPTPPAKPKSRVRINLTGKSK